MGNYKDVKAWRERNRDKVRHLDRIYKQTKRDPLYREVWPAILKHYGNKCLWCGVSGDYKKLCADHVRPLLCHGSTTLENLQPLCLTCNGRKRKLGDVRFVDLRPDRGAWIKKRVQRAVEQGVDTMPLIKRVRREMGSSVASAHLVADPVDPESEHGKQTLIDKHRSKTLKSPQLHSA